LRSDFGVCYKGKGKTKGENQRNIKGGGRGTTGNGQSLRHAMMDYAAGGF